MANNVTKVQGKANCSSSSGPFPTSLAYDSDVTAGDLLVCFMRLPGISSAPSITDTVSSTWAEVEGGMNGSSYVSMFWALAGGTGPNTIAISGAGTTAQYTIGQWNNPDGSWSVRNHGSDYNNFKFSPWITDLLPIAGLDDFSLVGWANETSNFTPTNLNGPTGYVVTDNTTSKVFLHENLSVSSITNKARAVTAGGTRAYICANFTPTGVAGNGNPRQRQTTVGDASGFVTGTGATATISLQANCLSSNSLIVLYIANSGGNAPTSVTDDQGNTYTQIISAANVPSFEFDVWVAPSGTTGAPSISAVRSTSGQWYAHASEIQNTTGIDATSPFTHGGTFANLPLSDSFTPTTFPALVRSYLYISQTTAQSPWVPTGDAFETRFWEDDINGPDNFSAQLLVQDIVKSSGAASQAGSFTGFSRFLDAIIAFDGAPAGPTINTQPSPQTVNAGDTATFSVSATSSGGSLTYQWKHTAGTISGATSSSYTTPTLSTGDDGDHFWCTVSDDNGSVDSTHVLLTVNALHPIIYSQPADETVTEPATATFGVTAVTSGGSLFYQWYNDSGPIYGALSATYTTGPTSRGADNGTHYWCTVTDDNGSTDTRHALLTVLGAGGGTRARIWMML